MLVHQRVTTVFVFNSAICLHIGLDLMFQVPQAIVWPQHSMPIMIPMDPNTV